jgi:hypothetical protein
MRGRACYRAPFGWESGGQKSATTRTNGARTSGVAFILVVQTAEPLGSTPFCSIWGGEALLQVLLTNLQTSKCLNNGTHT